VGAVSWRIAYFADDVQEAIGAFAPGLQARYAHLTEQRIMMLYAFVKKTQKTPARDLKIARQRLKEASHENS
jgi:hypothetical protein